MSYVSLSVLHKGKMNRKLKVKSIVNGKAMHLSRSFDYKVSVICNPAVLMCLTSRYDHYIMKIITLFQSHF